MTAHAPDGGPPTSQVTTHPDDTEDVNAAELRRAPDPVWPGMPRAEFERIGLHLRDTADKLGLRDWKFHLSWEPAEEGAVAQITVIYGKKSATVQFAEWFATQLEDVKHEAIVHELLHCHLDPLETLLYQALPELLGQPTWQVVRHAQRERLEHVVDAVTNAVARWLPGLPSRDSESEASK